MTKSQTLIVQLVRDSEGSSIDVAMPGDPSVNQAEVYSERDKSPILIRNAASDGSAILTIKNSSKVRNDIMVKHLVCNTVEIVDSKPVTLDYREAVCLGHMKLSAGDSRTIFVEKARMVSAPLCVLSSKAGTVSMDRLTEYDNPTLIDFKVKRTDNYYFYLNKYESKATLVARPNNVEVGEFSKTITGTIKAGEKKTYIFKARKGDVIRCESNLPRRSYYALLHQPDAYLSLSTTYALMMGVSSYQRIESHYKASHPDMIIVKEDTDIAASVVSYDPAPMPYTLRVLKIEQPMKSGCTIQGVLPVGDSAIYTIKGETGQRIRIDMSSKDFDTLLYISSAERYLENSNDDTGASSDSRLYFTVPKTGTYYVVATSVGGGGGGKYTITMSEDKASRLEPNTLVAGVIHYQQTATYILDVKKGQKVIIYLKSRDCLISLYDLKGEKLDESLGFRETDPYLIWYEPKETQTISVVLKGNNDQQYEFKWILVN